ncbi:PilZ domain-containing protein [Bdellovibrio reynosensis]|uniref:PilZ domain-containing protein n=1 Tax=Bdellovibrio reynosensis TaxID=2835041 RepID=A0ABY4CA88_9BACT|nr:PilZ domain-containing protein [Bdellovibrio reynosensis]UOF01883.1 PilZ domain-containing protein [Bdellovibrio reynosensis]
MNTNIYITGANTIPTQLKKVNSFNCSLIENPYNLRNALQQSSGENIIVVYLPFLEVRHFDLYSYLQKSFNNVKTIFIVNELSGPMRIRLKSNKDFIVLWKTEEENLHKDIIAYLNGKDLELRQDSRESHSPRPLLSPSLLPAGMENKGFQPILGGSFENISINGSCVKIKAPFYAKKDFINLSYQNKKGEYVQVEGQVRWTRWNANEEIQELGVQFLTQG